MVTRREFQIGATSPGSASTIRTPTSTRTTPAAHRATTHYCNEEVGRLIDLQSQEIDAKAPDAVWQIQKKLEEDAARPTMGWRTDRFAHYPYVKNLLLNQVTYNCCRLQEVLLDK
jgi:peptide/nickel transport system substrate-binding protein